MAMSILLVPIVLILLGSFSAFLLPADSTALKVLTLLGDKNMAMTIGVLYGAFISRPHLNRSITEIMNEGSDKIGLVLRIATGFTTVALTTTAAIVANAAGPCHSVSHPVRHRGVRRRYRTVPAQRFRFLVFPASFTSMR